MEVVACRLVAEKLQSVENWGFCWNNFVHIFLDYIEARFLTEKNAIIL